jgi:aminoglycoside 3-N-acetyltransferase
VGHLAEAFRTRPGARVTQSPSGRFGARGRLVDALFEHDPWHDYYGPGSVLERLCQLGGKVLRLGASPETTTALHYAEYLAPLPKKRRVVRHYRVMGPDGPETRSLSCLDDEHGIVDYPPPGSPPVSYPEDDYFAVLLGDYLARGEGARGVVGSAESCLLSAAELVAFGAEWMGRRLAGCPTTDQGASGEEHEDAGHDDHDDHDDHDGHDEGRGGRRP